MSDIRARFIAWAKTAHGDESISDPQYADLFAARWEGFKGGEAQQQARIDGLISALKGIRREYAPNGNLARDIDKAILAAGGEVK